jgi:replicative DNA helicase
MSFAERKIVSLQREMPHNPEAELGVLASATCSRDALSEMLDRLTIEHFYVPAHQLLFACFEEQERQKKPLDMIGMTDALCGGFPVEHLPEMFTRGRLERNGRPVITLEEIGGPAFVTHVFTFVPTAANMAYYIDIVREKFLARTVIIKCTELVRVAYDELTEISEVLEQAQSTLTEIIMKAERPDTFRDLQDGVAALMDKLEWAYRHRGKPGEVNIDGVATGIMDFDRMTHGLRPQQLLVIGARPGQGKSALAMNIAANMALENEIAVGVFSMEMSYADLIERVFCSTSGYMDPETGNFAGIEINKLRDGMLSRFEHDKLAPETASKLIGAKIYIDDEPALTVPSFKARARLMKMRHGVKVIVVDYLQLMRSLTRRAQDARWLEITEISGTLKSVAKELNIPVIACCQLNREAEARDSSFCKPRLSDLRESGSIEQDADIVALLWRPGKHLAPPKFNEELLARTLNLRDAKDKPLWITKKEDSKKKEELSPEQISERRCQIEQYNKLLVVKHRNGPPGEVRLRFLGNLTLFQNVTEKAYSNNPKERQQ